MTDAAKVPWQLAADGRPPVIGAWFWQDEVLETEGDKAFMEVAAATSPYTLLSTSLRISRGEVTDLAMREQVGKAARHAKALGLPMAYELRAL